MEHYISDDKWCIYYHMNKYNKKIYIGQTKNTKHRFVNNGIGYKNCHHFWRAIEKYGWDNFDHVIIIKDLTKEQADIIEIELIKKYDSCNENNGYNISGGGNNNLPRYYGEKHHASRKIYQYNLNGEYVGEWENAQIAGKQLNIYPLTINSCARKDKHRAGNYMWSYEKVDNLPNYSSYERYKISNYPKIYCVGFNGELQKIYDDIHKIEDYNYNECDKILQCCKGKRLSSKGFFWMFENNYTQKNVQQLIDRKFNKKRAR